LPSGSPCLYCTIPADKWLPRTLLYTSLAHAIFMGIYDDVVNGKSITIVTPIVTTTLSLISPLVSTETVHAM